MNNYSAKDHQQLLGFIDSYWDQLIIKPKRRIVHNRIITSVVLRINNKTNPQMLEVPYTCLVPNTGRFTYIFYWDSFFMFKGLLDTKKEWVIPEMVENLMFLFKKYQIIPNLNHPYALDRSQPPFLTSMIFDAYEVFTRDKHITNRIKKLLITKKQWLSRRINLAKEEYTNVWCSTPNHHTQTNYNHLVEEFKLNRYGDRDVGYALSSELESGWDLTSRYYSRCNEFLPVDLNCYLYKYEKDFAHAARILNKSSEQDSWEKIAEERKERMNNLMWNKKKGFFFDYDYVHKTQSEFYSLAGFVPLWAGLATYEQAKKAKESLALFETEYGLTITAKKSVLSDLQIDHLPEPYKITITKTFEPKQWDYPHIWSPLEYLTVIGLLRYGFIADAARIMNKAIKANIAIFKKYEALLEKIDSETGGAAKNHAYPNQFGFGWTNAAVYRYSVILKHLEEGRDIFEKGETIPHTFTIPH